MDAVIPIAAEDHVFKQAGYEKPKPLIIVNDEPMIKWATACLEGIVDDSSYIFPVLRSHINEYSIDEELRRIFSDDITIIPVDGMTDGPAETVLEAEEQISSDELLIVFGDQYVEVDLKGRIESTTADGLIPVFESSSPKWSYAATTQDGVVSEVAEKEVISEHATAGIYYFSNGEDCIEGTKRMISRDIRTNQLFYVCPIYNELIQMSRRIEIMPVETMVSLGAPRNVDKFQLLFDEITTQL